MAHIGKPTNNELALKEQNLWLLHKKVVEWEDSFLLTVGKSLALCQNFEINCKTALMWMDLATALKTQEVSLSEEEKLNDFVSKLMKRMLGENIKRLKEKYGINEKHISILSLAKDGRNFIAHDAAKAFFEPRYGEQSMSSVLPELYKHVQAVAAGDNMVASWNYEINEKEPAPHLLRKSYPDEVVKWVFSDFSPEEYAG
jgi:hypothetical protein